MYFICGISYHPLSSKRRLTAYGYLDESPQGVNAVKGGPAVHWSEAETLDGQRAPALALSHDLSMAKGVLSKQVSGS